MLSKTEPSLLHKRIQWSKTFAILALLLGGIFVVRLFIYFSVLIFKFLVFYLNSLNKLADAINFNVLVSNLISSSFPFPFLQIWLIESSVCSSFEISCHVWFNIQAQAGSLLARFLWHLILVSFLFSLSCVFLSNKSFKNVSPLLIRV